ncbi:MAG TPA: zinc/iron-chelating domain-containing protein [Pseudothermotoga sp.]|nr:zinc/iron-chelating domain-containing protein [Pseudothermotoga sp.]
MKTSRNESVHMDKCCCHFFLLFEYLWVFQMLKQLRVISRKVLVLYEELKSIHDALGVRCNGCRLCCQTAAYNIEATMLEFIPLALHLIENGEFDKWFEKAQRAVPTDRCVLLVDESTKIEGGCSFYDYRPLVCRLFSASYVRRRNIEVLSCQFLKRELSKKMDRLVDAQKYFDCLYDIDPYLAVQKRDINTAFKQALEYVGMKFLLNTPPSLPFAS